MWLTVKIWTFLAPDIFKWVTLLCKYVIISHTQKKDEIQNFLLLHRSLKQLGRLKKEKKSELRENAENFYAWDPVCMRSHVFSVTKENTCLTFALLREKNFHKLWAILLLLWTKTVRKFLSVFLTFLIILSKLSARYFLCLRQCHRFAVILPSGYYQTLIMVIS